MEKTAREIYEERLESASPRVKIFHKYFMQLRRNLIRKESGLSYDPNLIHRYQLHRIVEKEIMDLPENKEWKRINEMVQKALRGE
jgi:hypothetical protein